MPLKFTSLQQKNARHEPLFTAEEVAEKLGCTTGLLVASLRQPEAPKAVLAPFGSHRFTRALRYYRMSEMRPWWKKLQESKCPSPSSL